nr:histone-binding protein N1/N2-like isoform X2 [Cherax quadricarinatus]
MSETPQKAVSASPKSSPSKKEIDAATAALNHFAQGKRHLVVGDIHSAVNSLQEACRFLAEEYGETAPECGDAYFHYGKALLELARMESGVLGNALDGVPEGEDLENSQVESAEKATEEEWEMVAEKVSEALEENYESLEAKAKTEKGKINGEMKKEVGAESLNGALSLNKDCSNMNEGIVKGNDLTRGSEMKDIQDSSAEKANLEKEESEKEKLENEGNAVNKILPENEKYVNGNSKEAAIKVENDASNSDIQETSENKEGSTEDEEEEDGDEDGERDGDSQEGESQDEEGSKDESKSQDEGEGEKTEEDEEEVSNLQLAWEMLELAKVIFKKQEDSNPEMIKKVAQVYLKLGEVGLESENYAQGIEDFKQCLEIQEKHLEEDDRCLAETHYHLGVAHSFSDDFDKAVESFQAAVKVIDLRICNLNKRIKEKEDWTEEQKKKDAAERPDPFYTEQGEIDELNKLLPEIKEKIIDMEEMKKDTKEKLQKAAKSTDGVGALMARAIGGRVPSSDPVASQAGFDAPSSSTFSNAEAKSITHLVRKKRKPEEDAAVADIKKAKVENGESTTSEVTSTNGQSESMETDNKTSSKGKDMEELKKQAAEEMKKATEEITKEKPQATT